MTRVNNVEETTECETGYIPSELPVDPDESLQIAKLEWPPDNILVMPELIIPPDSEPAITKVCRLCNVENTTWFPFYKSDDSLALEEKHLEIIRKLASINITPKYDHAAVVCAYCLARIEEIAFLRDIWQGNEKRLAKDPTRMPSVEPTDQRITEDPEAISNVTESEENQSEQTSVDESIVIDDESDDSDVEIVSISEPPSKRYRTRSEAVKLELIDEALSIIGQQFGDTN
ncbi:AGAP002314-PA-like protein [Anopheles sinensis]|uniref:AGAP002314-PA-like protein n=1 Tax=Anopheles sinensis TaxID=74873 RepID=A0A084VR85_ANOSI|nr:AGAP002314-PA-like protein [Anopheles sinensis]